MNDHESVMGVLLLLNSEKIKWPTLKAEVLWTLNTVAKHQLYNSNDGIGELFKCMFPDSDFAKTFACGGDKTSYVTKLGSVEYIKRDLVSKVNNGPFRCSMKA